MLDRADPQAPMWQQRTDAADAGAADAWVFRQDRGELLGSKPGPGGSLLVTGYAAREGVLVYRNADGTTTREFVPLKTLQDSAKTLGRAPVTLEHPNGDVTPENIGALGVGDVGSKITIHDDGYVEVTAAVRRADALAAVRAGKVEFSPGYRVRIDATPGNHPIHGAYDAVQVERVVNHLAIVGSARGGKTIRFRADAADAVDTIAIGDSRGANLPRSGVRMINPRLLAVLQSLGITTRVDSDESAIEAINDHVREAKLRKDSADRERADALVAAERERDTARADAKAARDAETAIKAERDREKARADTASAELGRFQTEAAERADAAERIRIAPLCTKHRIDGTKFTSVADLKRALASAHLGAAFRSDANDEYVSAAVDFALVAQPKPGERASHKAWEQAGAGAQGRSDAAAQPQPSRWKAAFEAERK